MSLLPGKKGNTDIVGNKLQSLEMAYLFHIYNKAVFFSASFCWLSIKRLCLSTQITRVPADWGWCPTSEGGLGAIMGVWLSPFSAGSATLWSTLDSEVASLPASTYSPHERHKNSISVIWSEDNRTQRSALQLLQRNMIKDSTQKNKCLLLHEEAEEIRRQTYTLSVFACIVREKNFSLFV